MPLKLFGLKRKTEKAEPLVEFQELPEATPWEAQATVLAGSPQPAPASPAKAKPKKAGKKAVRKAPAKVAKKAPKKKR